MKKRSVTCIAALLLLSSALAACGETAADPKTSDTEAPVVTEEETDIYDLVPTPDLGGYEFRICSQESNFAYYKLDVESESGEALDDAIFRRNTEVESALNIDIQSTLKSYSQVVDLIKENVMAGDNAFDIYYDESGVFQSSSIYGGYCADMKNVSTINYDNPWWNKTAMDSVAVDSHRYYLYNDINVMFYECYAGYFVNRTMANDLDLPDFYNMVEEGKWTFDAVKSSILAASKDLNGDGKFDENDQYGCVFYDSCNPGYFTAAGTPLITKDASGKPVWNGPSQRMTDIYDKIVDCLFGNKDAIRTAGSAGLKVVDQTTFFHNGQSLFHYEPIGSLKRFRDVDFQIGLLPFPKYDEAQKEYNSFICYIAPACVVPVTCKDTEKVGSILEVMAAYSNKYVHPAYFETTLNFKYVQDEKSQEMLALILEKGQFDLADLYDWGTIRQKVRSLMNNPNGKWASTFETINDKIVAAIDATLNAES